MRSASVFLIALFCALCATTTRAHHGFAVHYDVATPVRIDGTIHAIQYRNPHAIIKVITRSDNGEAIIWTCETQAKSLLVRKGITADRFPIGGMITIEGSKARRHPNRCEVSSMLLPDGALVIVRSAEGHAKVAVNTAESASPAESIFGNWVRDSFNGAPVTPGFMQKVSEQGVAANAGYDGATDDPTRDCRPANPVRAMFAPGTPSQIRHENDRVVIQHEFMDTSRIVYLDATDKTPTSTPSEMGHSVGRIHDGVLTVNTNNFSEGVLLTHVKDSGLLHSDKMTLREVFSMDTVSGNLLYHWEATDPLFFTAPIGGQLILSPTTIAVDRYDCQRQTDD